MQGLSFRGRSNDLRAEAWALSAAEHQGGIMNRKTSVAALCAAMALLAGSFQASAAPKPSLEDPLGDANFINDQGTGDGSFGDFNQADAGTVSDLAAVTFSNDAKNLYVHFE